MSEITPFLIKHGLPLVFGVVTSQPGTDSLRSPTAGRKRIMKNAITPQSLRAERRAPDVFSGRDIALRCPRPRSSGRNVLAELCDLGKSFCRLTLRSATGTAQRAVPTRLMRTSRIATAAIALGFIGCKAKPTATAPPAPMVEVTAVTQADVPIYHEWIGVLDGLVNAQIRAQVTGYLLQQNYREGDPIKKGDLLFEIDPRPFQATLDQAKGLLAQAEARLGKTQLDVKRYAPLVKDRAISQEEYDDAVQANLEAEAAVGSVKAQVEQAALNLGFTKITSPIDGIASIATAQIGNLVGPGSGELTTVSTIDPIKAYYNVTEQAYINFTKSFVTEADRYEQLKKLEIDLILTDGTVYPQKGRIFAADREIGATTGALRLEGLFPNPAYALRPGEFARIRVKFESKHDALLVPQRAVSELQGSYQVAVVDETDKVHIQPVRVGERSGSLWVIEEGLHPGQRVVVEGIQKVREGVSVTTTNFTASMVPTNAAVQGK